jgi:hypothetical protein
MLWYDKGLERRVRGQLAEFRLVAEESGKGWDEFDLAPEFGKWVARQTWFERAAKRPSTLGTVLPDFEAHLIGQLRRPAHLGGDYIISMFEFRKNAVW